MSDYTWYNAEAEMMTPKAIAAADAAVASGSRAALRAAISELREAASMHQRAAVVAVAEQDVARADNHNAVVRALCDRRLVLERTRPTKH